MWVRKKSGDPNTRRNVLSCSFCNKSQDDVRKLIAGPTVFICNECVDVCVDILADDGYYEKDLGKPHDADKPTVQPTQQLTSTSTCTFCGRSTTQILPIAGRGLLCGECADAIEDALLRGQWLEDRT